MQLFQRLGVSTLPFVFILPGKIAADRERIKLRSDDSLKPETYEKFPWTVDEFSSFLAEKTGVSVGKVCFLYSQFLLPLQPEIEVGEVDSQGSLIFDSSQEAVVCLIPFLAMQVVRPSLLTSPFFPFIAVAALSLAAAAGYQLYYAPFMKNLLIWTAGAIAVYW